MEDMDILQPVGLDSKADLLMDMTLDKALESDSISERCQVLNAYSKRVNAKRNDFEGILVKLLNMDKGQQKLLAGILEHRGLIDAGKKGDISLKEAYQLVQG